MVLTLFLCFRNSGNVENVIDPFKSFTEHIDIEIAYAEDLDRRVLDPSEIGARTSDQASDIETSLKQKLYGMAADKSGAARNKCGGNDSSFQTSLNSLTFFAY